MDQIEKLKQLVETLKATRKEMDAVLELIESTLPKGFDEISSAMHGLGDGINEIEYAMEYVTSTDD
jgi:methyl-accepting chemotaxis protein